MEGERIAIAPMTAATVEAVHALEVECFSSPWSRQSLSEELQSPRAVFLTAEIGGEIAGYVGMHHILDQGDITNVAVSRRFRRRGVATALIRAILHYAEQNSLVSVTLEVRASNHAAIALYGGMGFQQVGLRRGYYTKPREDAVLMTWGDHGALPHTPQAF